MRNFKSLINFCLAGLLILAGTPLFGQIPTGAEIMAKHYQIPKPKTEVSTMVMTISKNGATLSRTMSNWAKGDNAKGEVEHKVVKFLAPGDIKGSGFLSLKKLDGSTESQLWLPAMGKIRRLSSGPSDQDSAFFGSDFANRDISGFIQADFTYKFLSSAEGLLIVEALPIKEAGYQKLIYSIDDKTFITRKIQYYKAGKMIKFQELNYTNVDAYQLPATITMTAASGSKTELKVSDQKVDQDLSDQVFSERFLKQ